MGRRRGKKVNNEKNNFQDAAMDREYNKGYQKGRRGGDWDPARSNRLPMDVLKDRNGKLRPINGPVKNGDEYYSPNEQLVKDAGQTSWNIATGRPILREYQVSAPGTEAEGYNFLDTDRSYVCVPGIMSLEVAMAPGTCNNSSDPYNVGALAEYNYLQHATGRAPTYSAQEVGMYNFALTSAYALYQTMARLYGTLQNTSLDSRYLPRALVLAQGFDYDSFKSDLANFRLFINSYVYKLAALPLPHNFEFTNRHLRLFEGVYRDSESRQAQMYLFKPAGFWTWVEGEESHPDTYIKFVPMASLLGEKQYVDFSRLSTFADSLLDALLNSEDVRMLGSDILNCFKDSLFTVTPVPEDYVVKPYYEEGISEQIENAYIYGINFNPNIGSVSEMLLEQATAINQGYLRTNYTFYPTEWQKDGGMNAVAKNGTEAMKIWDALPTSSALLNIHHKDSLDPHGVIHATRYTGFGFDRDGAVPNTVTKQSYYVGLQAQCFDFITNAELWFYYDQRFGTLDSSYIRYIFSSIMVHDTISQNSNAAAFVDFISQLSKFDWHPAVRALTIRSGVTDPSLSYSDVILDIDTFTEVSVAQLRNINNVAQLGMYIPKGLGAYSPS